MARVGRLKLPAVVLQSGLPAICRLTILERLAFGAAAVLVFLTVAGAICANFAIGDAPSGRMWGFFGHWAFAAFAAGVAAPWLLCRTIHASAVLGKVIMREWEPRGAGDDAEGTKYILSRSIGQQQESA